RSEQDSGCCLISGGGPNRREHSGFGAKETEYRCDCTSQAQPGYWLTRQVPPRPACFSNRRKSCAPACVRRMAMPRPENPVPRMAILQGVGASGEGDLGATVIGPGSFL